MKQLIKKYWWGIIIILCISNIFFIAKEREFPIKKMNCRAGYTDCSVVARFKDMDSCYFSVKTSSWYCDSTNPDNIQCRAAKPGETIATEYCTE